MIYFQNNLPIIKNKLHFNRYIKFIESRPLEDRLLLNKKQFNKHHIVPKCYWNENNVQDRDSFFVQKNIPYNVIYLTKREHYIAHLILWKAIGGKMTQAFFMMCYENNTKKRLTLKQYSKLVSEHKKYCSISTKNKYAMYNFYNSFSPLIYVSKNDEDLILYYLNQNYVFGNNKINHKHNHSSTKNKILIGKENEKYKNIYKKELQFYLNNGWSIGYRDDYKKNQSVIKQGYCWINNKKNQKWVSPDKVEWFLSLGWIKGRLPWTESQKKSFGKRKKVVTNIL